MCIAYIFPYLGLLRFAVNAGSHGSNDDAPTGNNEDQAWLREAIHSYATLTVNPVRFANVVTEAS